MDAILACLCRKSVVICYGGQLWEMCSVLIWWTAMGKV